MSNFARVMANIARQLPTLLADGVIPGSALADGAVSAEKISSYAGMPIGMPFPVLDHLSGIEVPSNAGSAKFIKLTQGLTGASQFNEGLLENESSSGSAPLVVATAAISVGPLAGKTIHLWNTEGRFPKPGTSSGTVANDQMQQITGSVETVMQPVTGAATGSGAITRTPIGTSNDGGANSRNTYRIDFDSANSTNARTGTSTDVKHEQVTYYMRIA